MNKPPAADRGLAVELDYDSKSRVSQVPDLIRTRNARRIRWHHVLVRRRRWSEDLDTICARLDPSRWWR